MKSRKEMLEQKNNVRGIKTSPNIFENILWEHLPTPQRSGAYNKMPDDAISVGFYATDKKPETPIRQIRFRFGSAVIAALGWQAKDAICILHDPDDVFHLRLIKSETSNGYRLSTETNSSTFRLQFTWPYSEKVKLKVMSQTCFDHHLYKQSLIVRLKNPISY